MSIDKFSKERFETALANIFTGYESLGLEQGEEVYAIPVNSNARLKIRSSVDSSGYAADTGQDSIRLWIEVFQPDFSNPENLVWKASGKKVDAYTTRVPGWEQRMEDKIRTLWDRAKLVRRPVNLCPECNQAPWVGFVKKNGKNTGRPFASHRDCNYFQCLDEPIHKGEKIEFDSSPNRTGTAVASEESDRSDEPVRKDNIESRYNRVQSTTSDRRSTTSDPEHLSEVPESDEQVRLNVETKNAKALLKKARKPMRGELYSSDKQPNDSQKEAIEADVDSDVRVLAPPGSGKTFTIEYRYKYLVQQGINTDNILVVTYSKKMADEMGERIKKTCPAANLEQISTIHAFCFRVLTRWDEQSKFYGWSVPKDWQVKKILDELIETVWQPIGDEELPGYKEVLLWINNSKFHGLDEEQAKNYFIKNLGARFGEWLYQIRKKFDARMQNQKFMLFSDMLYYTEQQLKYDEQFRTKWQNKFNHVIIDESQDTNFQALRVLITIGMEPGWNEFYTEENDG